jgi:DNA-directed RNA polymerase subunit RPC12/RpoP
MLCDECNFKRLHGGKSKTQVYNERKVKRGVNISEGNKNRSKPKKNNKKPTGERELFLEIWNERVHYCTKCSKWLGEEPLAHFFSHIKSKGAHPELRLNKGNIELLCMACHEREEFGSKKI